MAKAQILKLGVRVIKARVFSEDLYCRYGGDPEGVPLLSKGTVVSVGSGDSSSGVTVEFDNGMTWTLAKYELDFATGKSVVKITKPHKILRSPVKIKKSVYEQLVNAQAEFYAEDEGEEPPYAYMLGKDSRGVVAELLCIKSSGGCGNMGDVTSKEMSNAMLTLYKKHRIPCGIARVGEGDMLKGDESDRGDSPQELYEMNPKSIIITYDDAGLLVEGFDTRGQCITLNHKVVK